MTTAHLDSPGADEHRGLLAGFLRSCAEHPHADRQQLRQLVRNTLAERAKNKPPHAYRELFRALREAASTSTGDE